MEDSTTNTMIMMIASNYIVFGDLRWRDLLNCKDLANPLEIKRMKLDEITNLVWWEMYKKTIGQIRQ